MDDTAPTSTFAVFAPQPFPTVTEGDNLAEMIHTAAGGVWINGDIVVVASKVVSIAEKRHVDLAGVTVTEEARHIAGQTGKPPALVQLILDESRSHYLATQRGPIIATHHRGFQLTSAGVDRAGEGGAWLLPADPDASARTIRDDLLALTGTRVAVVIADSDGRPDRRGATVLSLGAAGIAPLRVTTHTEPDGRSKRQEETFTDLIAAAAGIVLGQRGRGAPVVVLRGIAYRDSDEGVASMLHQPADGTR
ncbi:MAG: coenzyme F420-0:L-glutamate ligase [Actinobacteria bacterium]|nr:coenzyme F420-0:L-glutamate ligase [Actinomycetota bacterium]MBI3687385.1 coenzyme F420-0:L-glutamate ligase [Actinomycetota bacterium]